ncbi:MAG: FAD-dependent oxidoreductase [Actinomyces graevenitzii]|nr:FAD-dependent oxidoreductase [Actinomyces graevenitzii]
MNLDTRNSSSPTGRKSSAERKSAAAPATPVVSHPNPLSDLPDEVDALVIGGGIAGLSAAWQLSQDGLKPLLVEARGYLGGLIAPGYIGPVQVDLGAETFVPRGVETAQMVAALGLEALAPSGDGARLFLPPNRANGESRWRLWRFLRDAYLGIPADPSADDVVAVLGAKAAQRAAQDRHLGSEVGQGAEGETLAGFVAARMGQAVVDRLVRPIVAGIYTCDPADLATDTVTPGLRQATREHGCLADAVAFLLARSRKATGGRSVDKCVRGGMFQLTAALSQAITTAGGTVLTRVGAQQLIAPDAAGNADTASGAATCGASGASNAASHDASDSSGTPDSSGYWQVVLAPTKPGPTPSSEPVPAGTPRTLRTKRLVVACSARPALRLLTSANLAALDTDITIPVGAPIARYSLLVDSPELDAAPVGQGLLVAPASPASCADTQAEPDQSTPDTQAASEPCGDTQPGAVESPVGAKALSHLNVKWPWIAQALAPHQHLLRLSYGRLGQSEPQVSLEQALADVRVLTGVTIHPEQVSEHKLVRWNGTLPPLPPSYRARIAAFMSQVENIEGLAVTGAWVGGTGVNAVVAHARTNARRLQRS